VNVLKTGNLNFKYIKDTMKFNYLAIIGVTTVVAMSCTPAKKEYTSYELYPVRSGNLTEMEYTPAATKFSLWAPTADEVV